MKTLNAIKEHFGNGDSFDYRDLSNKCGMNDKVCAMQLKRLYSSAKIGGFSSSSGTYSTMYYFYWDLESANRAVDKRNELMDKYDSRQKRLKHHKV